MKVTITAEDDGLRVSLGQSGGEENLKAGESRTFNVTSVQEITIRTGALMQDEERRLADARARGASVPLDPAGKQNLQPSLARLEAEEAMRPQLIGSSGTPNPHAEPDPRAVTSPKMTPPSRVAVGPVVGGTNAGKPAESKEQVAEMQAEAEAKAKAADGAKVGTSVPPKAGVAQSPANP